MLPPGITIQRASLSFGDRPLFCDLATCFEAGTWSCLLGRSGSGKSTLLRMIAGLSLPDQHQLDMTLSDGQVLRGRLAWMSQQDLLVPWLKVADNVMLGARWRGRPSNEDRARAHMLLARVGLATLGARWPQSLSGGQRQRVALARTLFEDAGVVLMDEPFSAVDAMTRHELHELASELLAGRTVIMVTHDPLEALRLADRILVLQGDPASLTSFAVPSGERPRALDNLDLQVRHAQLLTQLREPAHG